jgi:hypothetical protein
MEKRLSKSKSALITGKPGKARKYLIILIQMFGNTGSIGGKLKHPVNIQSLPALQIKTATFRTKTGLTDGGDIR